MLTVTAYWIVQNVLMGILHCSYPPVADEFEPAGHGQQGKDKRSIVNRKLVDAQTVGFEHVTTN